jgi:hypothetical protein
LKQIERRSTRDHNQRMSSKKLQTIDHWLNGRTSDMLALSKFELIRFDSTIVRRNSHDFSI